MKKETRLFLTIGAGKYKGKKVILPNKNTTRSSKAILRGSLFDRLQFDLDDKFFVEAFAGSGSVGLEALSRGIDRAYFIEKDRDSFNILRENVTSIDSKNSNIIFGDSFVKLKELYRELQFLNQKGYFYFDPPFAIREGNEQIYNEVIELIKSIPTELVEKVVIEHQSSIKFYEQIGNFVLEKTKKFGKSSLSYYVVME